MAANDRRRYGSKNIRDRGKMLLPFPCHTLSVLAWPFSLWVRVKVRFWVRVRVRVRVMRLPLSTSLAFLLFPKEVLHVVSCAGSAEVLAV